MGRDGPLDTVWNRIDGFGSTIRSLTMRYLDKSLVAAALVLFSLVGSVEAGCLTPSGPGAVSDGSGGERLSPGRWVLFQSFTTSIEAQECKRHCEEDGYSATITVTSTSYLVWRYEE